MRSRPGCAAYLRKPVRREELHQAVARGANPRARTPTERPHPPMPCRPAPMHAERILVAEDNIVNQRVLLALLRSLGYQAQAVANGHEVLDAVGPRRFFPSC